MKTLLRTEDEAAARGGVGDGDARGPRQPLSCAGR